MNPFPKIDLEDLPPFLLIYGKDNYFRSRCLNWLRDRVRGTCEIFDLWCDDKTKSYEVINAVDRQVMPFEKVEQRAVFIWDFQRVKDRDKKLMPYLEDPAPDTLVVFILTESSRAGGAFIKALKKGFIYEAVSPEVNYKVDELAPWIQRYFRKRGLFVEEQLCRGLHAAVGQDLFVLESEMRRILTYCEGRKAATLADFARLVVPRVHAQPFDLTKVLVKRDLGASMRTLHEMFAFAVKPDDMVFLGTIVRLKDTDDGTDDLYKLVGQASGNFDSDEIEVTASSPMGEALMKSRVGETVKVDLPRGVKRFEVVEIV